MQLKMSQDTIRIENSVTRDNCSTSLGKPRGDALDRIFIPHLRTIKDSNNLIQSEMTSGRRRLKMHATPTEPFQREWPMKYERHEHQEKVRNVTSRKLRWKLKNSYQQLSLSETFYSGWILPKAIDLWWVERSKLLNSYWNEIQMTPQNQLQTSILTTGGALLSPTYNFCVPKDMLLPYEQKTHW